MNSKIKILWTQGTNTSKIVMFPCNAKLFSLKMLKKLISYFYIMKSFTKLLPASLKIILTKMFINTVTISIISRRNIEQCRSGGTIELFELSKKLYIFQQLFVELTLIY